MENVRKLDGKTAVITGASRGIGYEITKLFASNGANIIACAREKNDEFERECSQLSKENQVEVLTVYFDMSDAVSVKNGIKEIKALKKSIDILINNAGIPHLGLVPMITVADMQKVFQVNYFSQIQIVQGLYRTLCKSKGIIINMSSAAGFDGEAGNSIYGATKASMAIFTKVLSNEMAEAGVRVNGIAPGLTQTGFSDVMGDKAKETMVDTSNMHRLGKPEEIAKTALFLACDDSSFINGQVIRVDGGM